MNLTFITFLTALSSTMFTANVFNIWAKFMELLDRIISIPLDLWNGITSTVAEAQFFLGRLIATNFGVFLLVIILFVLFLYSIYYVVFRLRKKV